MSQRSPRSVPRLRLRKILPRTRPQQLWLYGIVAVCIFLLFCTLGYPWPFGSGALNAFNLRDESNLAATWSAMLLLVAAMHAFDGWALNRPPSGSVAISWLLLSAVLVALSLDETGSFHERFPTWLSLLPIAIVFGGMFSYAIFVLFRAPEYRANSILIVVAVALFGSVALQEFIEQRFVWPGHLRSLRAVVEEGTELLAMVLLVLAAMPNTRGVLADDSESKAPAFDVVTRWRTPLVLAGILGAPAIAFVTASLDHSYAFHGVATDWLVAVFFLLATFATLRPVLSYGASIGWQGWALALIGVIGCGASVLHTDTTVPLLGGLTATALPLWGTHDRYRFSVYVPIAALIAVCLAFARLWRADPIVSPTLVQYVALGFFVVASSSESPPPSDEQVR